MFDFGGRDANGLANLVPLKTILPYLLGKKGLAIAIFELVGNIGILIPFGFLVAIIFRNMTWRQSFIFAFVTGFMIEGTQALLHTGIFDIDDILLNGLGVVIGYWLFTLLQRRQLPTSSHKQASEYDRHPYRFCKNRVLVPQK